MLVCMKCVSLKILKSRLYFLNSFANKEVYIVLIQLKEIIELMQPNQHMFRIYAEVAYKNHTSYVQCFFEKILFGRAKSSCEWAHENYK